MTHYSIWFLELTGNSHDLLEITHLGESTGVNVVERDGKFILEIPQFDRAADPDTVLGAAEEDIRFLNGLGQVFLQNWRGFGAAALRRRERDKPPTSFIMPEGIPSGERFGLPMVSVEGEKAGSGASLTIIQAAGALSRADADVSKLLRLLGTTVLDYRQLYVAYEVIEHACSGIDGVVKLRVASKSRIRRFKRTANSVAVLGDEARHGKESTNPPSNPMSIKEALVLIRELSSAWISTKAG